jgi:RecA-family ATPase
MESVARELLGEPNRAMSTKGELRYGSHGSLSVDLRKGTFYDHEAGEGGGVLDLIERVKGLHGRDREEWVGDRFPHVITDRPKTNGRAAKAKPLGKEVAHYDYTDEAGSLLFQVVRFEPKTFRQRHREGDRWVWGARGIRQVPYRLTDLLEAIAQEHVIFVVEGERDVETVIAKGAPATCNAGGAGKWLDSLNDYFRDADVVVIPDNDPQARNPKGELRFHDDGRPVYPGQDHARAVCANLAEVARRVRYLDLKAAWPQCPPKGDASDFFAAGHTLEQLYDIAEHAPDWSPELPKLEPEKPPGPPKLETIDLAKWEGLPVPARRWVVRERIPARNVTGLSGDGGVGKTLLMQQLAVATVLGRDWIGELPEFGPVVLVSAEDDDDEIHFRLDKIAGHYGATFRDLAQDLHIVSLAGKNAVMATVGPQGIVKPTPLFESLCNLVREVRPRWIGIDTAADVFVVDERDRSQARQCISLLRGLALEVDTAVILLSHPSLQGMASGSGLSGSTAWSNSVRSRLYLRTPKKSEIGGDSDDEDEASDVRILELMKSNYARKGEQVRLQWKDGLLVKEGQATPAPAATTYNRADLEHRAQQALLTVVRRYNENGMTLSAEPNARNFAPAVVANLNEGKALDPVSVVRRKRLLRKALDDMLGKRLTTEPRPLNVSMSRRKPSLVVIADMANPTTEAVQEALKL